MITWTWNTFPPSIPPHWKGRSKPKQELEVPSPYKANFCFPPSTGEQQKNKKQRTSQARSAQRCRMRSFSLHFVKQARDSTRQGALRKLVGASWSAQVALRKLHCASCAAQVAPRKLLRQVGPCKLLCANCAPCKLLCASCSAEVALRKLL